MSSSRPTSDGAAPSRRVRSVLHLLTTPAWGGMEKSAHLLLRTQRELFPDRRLAVMFGNAHGPNLDQFARLGVTIIDAGVRRSWALWKAPALARVCDGFDVVQHYCEFSPFLAAARHCRHARHLYVMRQNLGSHEGRWNLRLRVAANALFLRRMHALAGNNSFGAARLAERLGLPRAAVTPVPNGFDVPPADAAAARAALVAEFGLPHDALILLSSGRLSPQKRPYLALRIASEAARRAPRRPLALLFYGDGGERAALEKLAAEAPAGLSVRLAGWRSDVWTALAGADLFVFTGYLDGFANTVAEAVASGLPALVWRDGGGALEHITPDVEGCVTGELDEAAAYVLARAALPAGPRAAAGADSPLAARYSRQRMAWDYERLYDRVLAGAPVAP